MNPTWSSPVVSSSTTPPVAAIANVTGGGAPSENTLAVDPRHTHPTLARSANITRIPFGCPKASKNAFGRNDLVCQQQTAHQRDADDRHGESKLDSTNRVVFDHGR